MTTTTRVLFLLAAGLSAAACSSSSNDTTGGGADGGDGGSTGGDASDDAVVPQGDGGAACVLSSDVDPYCRVLICPGDGCTKSADCQRARADQCPAMKASASAALQAATLACKDVSCKDLSATTACLFQHIDGSPRTTTEQELAAHYCAACAPDAGGDCVTAFYDRSSTLGLTLLLYADTVLAEVDTTCVSASTCGSFASCAGGVTEARTPKLPSACN